MKRLLTGLLLAAACLACGGCLVLATVAAVGAVATTTVKTGTKVATTTVETTGHVASAAVNAATETSGLSMESAARLSQPGLVVLVDGGTGAVTKLPWKEGLTLGAAASSGKAGTFGTANIFRGDHRHAADLRQSWTADLALQSGDVVELRR